MKKIVAFVLLLCVCLTHSVPSVGAASKTDRKPYKWNPCLLVDFEATRGFYTGREFGSHGCDVDHVVAIADAEKSGARKWSDEKKQQFGNDPQNLVVSLACVNRSKGKKTPAKWLKNGGKVKSGKCKGYGPTEQAKRLYCDRYLAVKKKYDLKIAKADKKACR